MVTSSIKRKVMRAFDRSAAEYSRHARFQEEIARETAAMALRHASCRGRVIDLGCGDGALLAAILESAPIGDPLAMDLSAGMCAMAKARLGQKATVIRADAESLPFATSSADMIVSSLALQWVEDMGALFAQIARVLKPSGVLVAATLGPGTFPELRHAARQAQNGVRIQNDGAGGFCSVEKLESALSTAGFTSRIIRAPRERHYPDFGGFLRSLKNVGAMGAPLLAGAGLARRGFLQRMEREYENSFRCDLGLKATYDVVFIEAIYEG